MTKVITAFEAPALLDAHPTLTRYALYQRLTGQPEPKGSIGLATCISDGAMRFAQDEFGWAKPVNKPFEIDCENGIKAQSRGYLTEDSEGPLLVVFLHLADFIHRNSWGKSGVPPLAFIIQANWVMWQANQQRMAFLVLSDKRVVVYHVDRNQGIIDQLAQAIKEMGRAIENNEPPPIDALPSMGAPTAAQSLTEGSEACLDDLVRRWLDTSAAKAETANTATFAEQAAEAASQALKNTLPMGAHHDCDDNRVHHNAKTGRLTMEKINGAYF